MEQLTVKKAVELAKTKTIVKWKAPIYEGNDGFYGKGLAGGVAQLQEVYKSMLCEKDEFHLKAYIVEGDDLNYAKAGGNNVPSNESNLFFFSDSDRYVTFKISEG